jgi:ABC-type transport system involved in multi-copper enzyme maturation permease subunit
VARRARAAVTRFFRSAMTLLPHSLLFSAIFQKEMRVSGRKPSTFVTRAVYGILLVALASLVFMGVRSGTAEQTGAAAIQSLQDVAPTVTGAILWFQMIFLPMIACMITGPSVCDEVRNRSLPALLTTPLSAPQIIFSKLSGALVHVVILALVSLPLLLGLRVFGGIDTAVVLGGAAITLTTALLAGSVGMLVSVYAKRSALAGSAAIAGTLGLLFIPVPVLFLMAARGLLSPIDAYNAVGVICGPVNLGMTLLVASGNQPPGGVWPVQTLILANIAYNLAASIVLLVLASVAFRRRLTGDRGEAVIGAPDKPGLLSRRQRREMKRAAKAARRTGGPPAAVLDTPRCTRCGLDLSALPPGAPCPGCAPSPAMRWEMPRSRTVGDRPVLWREVRRQGARAASRRVGLPAAVLTMAMLAVMGVFLPVYGAFDGLSSSEYTWTQASDRYLPLLVATAGFAIMSAALAILTAWRALKRIGLGGAIVTPPREVLVLIMVLGGLLFAYWAVDGEFTPLHAMVGAIGPGLIFLRAATQNAGTLAEEREARTWETLLTTRLSPREILVGKLAGALARQWDIPAIVLIHFAFAGVVLDGLTPLVLVHLALTMLAGITFLSGTGMLCALVVNKGSVASLLNAAIALTLWLVLPLGIAMMLMAANASASTADFWGTVLVAGQPLPLGVMAVFGAVESAGSSGMGSTGAEYRIFDHALPALEFTLVLVGVCAIYVLAGLAALASACLLFNRRTGRTS